MKNSDILTYEDKKSIINDYLSEIIRACAICKDFKISYEKMFKYDFLIGFAYEMAESKKLYVAEYTEQCVYNDFYKRYGKIKLQLNKMMRQMVYNIEQIIIYYANIFNYNIIKTRF